MEFSLIYRSKIIINAYSGWISGSSMVLDIGCGNAVVTDELKRHFGCDLTGTDIMDYRKRDIPFELMKSKRKLPFKDKSFDAAMFNDVLHHCEAQEDLLREAARVAKKILIFEMEPTLTARIADFIVNKIHNSKMNAAFEIRRSDEWKGYFKKMKFDFDYRDIKKPFTFYPFVNFSFKIETPV